MIFKYQTATVFLLPEAPRQFNDQLGSLLRVGWYCMLWEGFAACKLFQNIAAFEFVKIPLSSSLILASIEHFTFLQLSIVAIYK